MSQLKTGILSFVLAGICSFSLSAQRLVPCGKAYCDSATEQVVLPPKYDETFPFRNGYAVVRMGKKYKAIDTTGAFVTKKAYRSLYVTDVPGLFLAQRNKRGWFGLIRPDDQIVLETKYFWFFEGDEENHYAAVGPYTLMEVHIIGKRQFITGLARTDGKFLVQPSTDSSMYVANELESTQPPRSLEEARYALRRGYDWFIFDGNGKNLGQAPHFLTFWGMNIITVDGEKIGFRRASDLSEIKAPENLKENYRSIMTKTDLKWGIINKAGELVVPAEYDEIHYSFSKITESPTTPVIVKKGDKWGVIDLKNDQLIGFQYEEILPIKNNDPFGNPYFAVKKDGKWGVSDAKGKIIGQIQYDEIGEGTSGGKEFRVRLKKKWGTMSSNGEVQWEK